MRFSVGDPVWIRDERLKGTVVRLVEWDNMVEVRDENGDDELYDERSLESVGGVTDMTETNRLLSRILGEMEADRTETLLEQILEAVKPKEVKIREQVSVPMPGFLRKKIKQISLEDMVDFEEKNFVEVTSISLSGFGGVILNGRGGVSKSFPSTESYVNTKRVDN